MTRGRKKILMLTHEFAPAHGGIARYATELAVAAAGSGHEVTVVAPDYGQDQTIFDDQLPFRLARYPAANYGPKELPSLFWRVARLNSTGYDLVHAVDPSFVMALAFARRFRAIDYQATVYGTDILGLRTSVQATMTGTRRMFEYPSRLVAISQFTKGLLLEKCPRIPSDRIEISPLGVSQYWFELATPIVAIPQLAEIGNKILLATVARLDSRKGHRTMLRGLAALPEHLKRDIVYAIVGTAREAEYQQELQRLAAQSGCDVRFLGNLNDEQVRWLYARASLFCMPGEPDRQKVEGFGLVYLEAAAQGLPSLASFVGAVPEVVLNEQTGWLVEPSKPEAIAAKLRELLTNRERLQVAGEHAKEFAKQFTWKRCAEITYGEAA